MSNYDLPEPKIVRIAEDVYIIEGRVSLAYPRPEAVLIDALASYMAGMAERRAIVSTNTFYDENEDEFVLTLVFGEPIES